MAVSANKLGRYELRREIARSNDVVYEAWDPTVNRRVAVKELVMPPGMTGSGAADRIQRFYREARAAGQLSHPNIVTIYEVGEDVGRHFIAMEFLEGPTLRESLQGGTGLPVAQCVEITAQIADALAYAHSHGVVHRDVKPDNVHLVTPTHPKLTDFGIARIEAETNITLSGQVFGTPSYMSPEQVAGGAIDARTDIFSLGVMLFEMLAGRKPFTGESVVTITYNIVHEPVVVPSNVPEWLAGILRRAMAKDPNLRYQTAAELAEDIRNRHAPYVGHAPNGGIVPSPTAWGPGSHSFIPAATGGLPAPPAGLYVFQAADPPKKFTLPKLPKLNLSDEARTFTTALGVTLAVGIVIAIAIWASSVAYDQQREQHATAASAETLSAATRAYNNGDYPTAIKGFSDAYSQTKDPKYKATIRDNLINSLCGEASQETGDKQLATLEQAAKLDPDNPTAQTYLGEYYDQAGDKATAIRYYESVLSKADQAPQQAEAVRPRLGVIYLDLGNQANQGGPINGMTDRDYWGRAALVDPTGQAGIQADTLLRGAPATGP